MSVEKGRESFQTGSWGSAFSLLSAADAKGSLDPQDLILLAQAALLIGKQPEAMDLLGRAHRDFLDCGQIQPAVRCAFWLGFQSLLSGEFAKAGGWLSKAARLLDGQPESAENGYLLMAEGYRCFHAGDSATAHSSFAQAIAIGERFEDK